MRIDTVGHALLLGCPDSGLLRALQQNAHVRRRRGDEILYAARMAGLVSNGPTTFASQCGECGECMEKCPQHLPIPELLKKVAEEMEGPELEGRIEKAIKFFHDK